MYPLPSISLSYSGKASAVALTVMGATMKDPGKQQTMWNLKILTALTVLVISGCAATTVPIPLSSAKQGRVLAFQAGDAEHTANIIVIRDAGSYGSACLMGVLVNGVLAARLDTGEFASLFIKPGKVVISVITDPMGRGLCSYGTVVNYTSITAIMKVGQKKAFRAGNRAAFLMFAPNYHLTPLVKF